MKPWRNAGLAWFRRAWEGVARNQHYYAYTEKGLLRKLKRARKK